MYSLSGLKHCSPLQQLEQEHQISYNEQCQLHKGNILSKLGKFVSILTLIVLEKSKHHVLLTVAFCLKIITDVDNRSCCE